MSDADNSIDFDNSSSIYFLLKMELFIVQLKMEMFIYCYSQLILVTSMIRIYVQSIFDI